MIDMIAERIDRAGLRATASSSTAFRAPCRRPRRSTRCWPKRGLGLDHVIEIEVDEATLIDRLVGPVQLREVRRQLSRTLSPASSRRRLRCLRQPANWCIGPTTVRRRYGRDLKSIVARRAPILPYYRDSRRFAQRRRDGRYRRGHAPDRGNPRIGGTDERGRRQTLIMPQPGLTGCCAVCYNARPCVKPTPSYF